jgi:hypothetical protein
VIPLRFNGLVFATPLLDVKARVTALFTCITLQQIMGVQFMTNINESSPAAWQHIHFAGYFSFYDNRRKIDIDEMLKNILFN